MHTGLSYTMNWDWESSTSSLHFRANISPADGLTNIKVETQESAWILEEPTMEDGRSACLFADPGESWQFSSVIFSQDSKLLPSASCDKTVKVWDASSGQCLQILNIGKVTYVKSFDIMYIQVHLELLSDGLGGSACLLSCNKWRKWKA
jgi:WD40 repeat protein